MPSPKSTETARTRYLFHPKFDLEKGFGKVTGAMWIRSFWFDTQVHQDVSDAMTNIERFLNREAVSQRMSLHETSLLYSDSS